MRATERRTTQGSSHLARRASIVVGVALGLVASGCAGSGEGLDDRGNPIYPTRVHGIVTDKDLKPLGPGLMFIEWGKVWGGDFRWTALVDENGRFEREVPTGGQENPEYGFHWYFNGFIYIATPMFLHPGEDNNLNIVLYETYSEEDLAEIPPLASPPGALAIFPLVDDDLKDNPVIANPKVTPLGGGLIRVEIDAMSPKGNLSEQILVNTDWGAGVKMNPPTSPDDKGNFPNGHYTVTMQVPASQPDLATFRFVADDHDCNNSDMMKLEARVR